MDRILPTSSSKPLLSEITLPVHRLLPFSNVEGSGNRCSIFLQGCNLNCIYCHNSETIPIRSSLSRQLTIEEIIMFVKQSMPFIRGITVSGGEPTLHSDELKYLFEEIHRLKLSCYIDTNGFFDCEKMDELINVTDKFLFDVKGDDHGLTQVCFQGKNESFCTKEGINSIETFTNNSIYNETTVFKNLKYLLSRDKIEEVRFVYIKDFYHIDELIKKIADQLSPYKHVPLKIIPVHLKGMTVNRMKLVKEHVPSPEEVENLRSLARKSGITIVN